MSLIGRRAFVVCVLLAFLFTPSAGRGADVDDLKATHEQVMAAANKRDLDTWSSIEHDQIVFFGPFSPFPTEGKVARRRSLQVIFDNIESYTGTPLNLQYRVVGDTGIVWGHISIAAKPKDGPMQVFYGRETVAYTKVDGKWRVVAVHVSAIPSGN